MTLLFQPITISEESLNSEVAKAKKQTIKQITAKLLTSTLEASTNSSDKEIMSDALMNEANKPPMKTPQCYSMTQTCNLWGTLPSSPKMSQSLFERSSGKKKQPRFYQNQSPIASQHHGVRRFVALASTLKTSCIRTNDSSYQNYWARSLRSSRGE